MLTLSTRSSLTEIDYLESPRTGQIRARRYENRYVDLFDTSRKANHLADFFAR